MAGTPRKKPRVQSFYVFCTLLPSFNAVKSIFKTWRLVLHLRAAAPSFRDSDWVAWVVTYRHWKFRIRTLLRRTYPFALPWRTSVCSHRQPASTPLLANSASRYSSGAAASAPAKRFSIAMLLDAIIAAKPKRALLWACFVTWTILWGTYPFALPCRTSVFSHWQAETKHQKLFRYAAWHWRAYLFSGW